MDSSDDVFTPGTPTDLRPRPQVQKRAEGPIGDFEYWSARVIARFTGEPVVLQDNGSEDGMADIRIDYRDRAAGFAEVWVDIDQRYASMYSNLMKVESELPLAQTEPNLSRVWFVTISGSTHVRKLTTEIGSLLAALEATGSTFETVVHEDSLKSHPDPTVQTLVKRGVLRLSSRPCAVGEQGTVRLYPGGISGSPLIAWDEVISWLNQTLSSPRLDDVRAKLAKTQAEERQVFIGVTYSSPSDVFFALGADEEGLPPQDPDLPSEITHVWLMRTPVPGRCVAWSPDRGWFDPAYVWATE